MHFESLRAPGIVLEALGRQRWTHRQKAQLSQRIYTNMGEGKAHSVKSRLCGRKVRINTKEKPGQSDREPWCGWGEGRGWCFQKGWLGSPQVEGILCAKSPADTWGGLLGKGIAKRRGPKEGQSSRMPRKQQGGSHCQRAPMQLANSGLLPSLRGDVPTNWSWVPSSQNCLRQDTLPSWKNFHCLWRGARLSKRN